jgi:hypothetical protein
MPQMGIGAAVGWMQTLCALAIVSGEFEPN